MFQFKILIASIRNNMQPLLDNVCDQCLRKSCSNLIYLIRCDNTDILSWCCSCIEFIHSWFLLFLTLFLQLSLRSSFSIFGFFSARLLVLATNYKRINFKKHTLVLEKSVQSSVIIDRGLFLLKADIDETGLYTEPKKKKYRIGVDYIERKK